MSWEWRIFYTDSKFNPWKSSQEWIRKIENELTNAQMDNRPDVYLDLKNPDSGLKERGASNNKNPKLELKVRQNHQEGIEYWEKCMSTKIRDGSGKDEALKSEMIIQYLQEELQNKEFMKSEKSIDTIKNIIEHLKNDSPSRIIIEKNRKQFNAIFDEYSGEWKFYIQSANHLPDSILIEYTNIDIDKGKSQTPKSFLTICVEGKNIEYIKKFKKDFINVDEGRIMGYPELIMNL